MQLRILIFGFCLLATTHHLWGQCISDDCGDIVARFILDGDQTVVCEGTAFTVKNLTTDPDIDYYIWNWGDGTRDTVFTTADQTHTYYGNDFAACASSGFRIFDISLEIYRTCSNGRTSCHFTRTGVLVKYKPRVEFVQQDVCQGEEVGWTVDICHADSVHWDFGDGTYSDQRNPSKVYDTPGGRWVKVTAFNGCGMDVDSGYINVIGQPNPQVDLGGALKDGCAPHELQIENQSEYLDHFEWRVRPSRGVKYIDGTGPDDWEPKIRFKRPGIYTVRLSGGNECNDAIWEETVRVYDAPSVTLAPEPPGCNQVVYVPDAEYYEQDIIERVEWQFINGSPATATGFYPGSVTYNTSGQAIVSIFSDCGNYSDTIEIAVETPANIDINGPTAPLCFSSDPVQLTAEPAGGIWSGFATTPDGTFDPAAAGPGTYTIRYTLPDACGSTDTTRIEVRAAVPVVVEDPFSICENDPPRTLLFAPKGGAWSGPGITDPANGVFDPAVSGAGPIELRYQYIDVSGCVVNKFTVVTVEPIPDIQLVDTVFTCALSNNVDLYIATGATFNPEGGQVRWYGPGVVDPVNGVFNASGPGGFGYGDYPIRITYEIGECFVEASTVVRVRPPAVLDAGSDQRVCITEETLNLSATPAGGFWAGPGIDSLSGRIDLRAAGDGWHTYIYRHEWGTSCAASDTVRVEVVDFTNIWAGPDLEACLGTPDFRIGQSATPTGGYWSGPAIVDSLTGQVDLEALTPGVYAYVYTLSDPEIGCRATDMLQLTVKPLPVARFTIPDQVCIDQPVQFRNASSGECKYQWDFGDGVKRTGEQPTHTYTESGTYTVELTVTSCQGCKATYTQEITILPSPTVSFAPNVYQGCAPLTVNFRNNSVGAHLSFEWDFGNGQTSTDSIPPPQVYPQPMNDTTYRIRLRVGNGCEEVIREDSILVKAIPRANFGIDKDDGCSPLFVDFSNTSIGQPDWFQWDFGNGTYAVDANPPRQTYYNARDSFTIYPITLIAGNECGIDTIQRELLVHPKQVKAFISVDTSRGCAPLTVDFGAFNTPGSSVRWDFGDGSTTAAPNAFHTFSEPGTYTVQQFVNNGCAYDTARVDIKVWAAPEARFIAPPSACMGDTVQFENISPQVGVSEWDFGNGTTSRETHPRYAFPEPGTYTVRLTVYGADNDCPATITQDIIILGAPTAEMDANRVAGCPPFSVCFSNTSQNAFSQEWYFDDGESTTEVAPCHTFEEPGRYQVRLRTFSENGCFSDEARIEIVAYERPEARMVSRDTNTCGLPDTLRIANKTAGASDYSWDLGDRIISKLANPIVVFDEPGTHTIRLVASNGIGCRDTAVIQHTSLAAPEVDFEPSDAAGCVPVEVTFRNNTVDADAYEWTFGNGETSTEREPTVTFDTPGLYSARLVATFQGQCADTLELIDAVDIIPSAIARLSYEQLDIPGQYQFLNYSEDANSYLWDFGDGVRSNLENPVHQYRYVENEEDRYTVTLMALNPMGCPDTASVELGPGIFFATHFPNAFTPEAGQGDVRFFKPAGVGMAEFYVAVYSPWGEILWESTDMNGDKPAAAWDGRHQRTGKLLPQGAYAYRSKVTYINGEIRTYMGSVTLLR